MSTNSTLERDLVIIEHKLESFAEKIWRKQGFNFNGNLILL